MNPQAQKLLKIVGLIVLIAILGWLSTRSQDRRTEAGREPAGSRVASTEPAPPAKAAAPDTPVEAKAFVRPASSSDLAAAFRDKRSGVMVGGAGRVRKVLPDDTDGTAHQRFIVTLADGQTILITHNVDLASRVPVNEGDTVEFHGQFEWNDQGGLVHWTHHDPAGKHAEGWIRHDGKTYR